MSSTELLRGQKVVLIGGSSGVGKSIAVAAVDYGASVVIASSSSDRVQAAVELLKKGAKDPGVSITGQVVEYKNQASLTAFLSQEGPFDHLVITAGRFPGVMRFPHDEIGEAFKGSFDAYYWPLVTAAQHIYKNNLMRPGGSITSTIGTTCDRPLPGWSLLSGPVGAVASVTRGLAVDLKPIRVNSISLGLVDTEIFDTLPGEIKEGIFNSRLEKLPVGHVGLPSEVAEAYIFAMRCTYLNGQIITVDGGSTLV
ncbi:Enoyl-(Acyl carrier protein) reductase [Rhizoctonia solani]|uniref:Enoyl-(Acyl carrier protein) reductase n=1 Tax=Rhizoctonia solani TaxID=456999 RepID=A0A8H7H674_9AGAM|nr:Enoyl-(Acyl carrier protein) reductase [Rhizoctonia solani]